MSKKGKKQGGIILKKYNKIIGLLLAVALLLPGMATKVSAAENDVTRLAGDNRIETSIKISKDAYANGSAAEVVLAGWEGKADALTGTYLASAKKAPLLFTRGGSLDTDLLEELERLGTKTVYALGGTTVISDSLVTALEAKGMKVERVSGDNRFATAEAAAKKVSATAKHVFLAYGWDELADALAVGPASAKEGMPILLTETNALRPETVTAMKNLGVEKVTILGGTAVVSKAIEDKLVADLGAANVTRVSGANRFATATAIAGKYFAGATKAIVANSNPEKNPDALVAGYFGEMKNAPILLTPAAKLDATTAAYLANVTEAYIVGGATAVNAAVEAEAKTAITPLDAAVVSVSAINATDLKVTLKGKTEADLKAADFAVTVNGTDTPVSVTKVSDTEYKLQVTVPLVDGDVVVVKALEGSVSTTYKTTEVTKVEAIEQTVYTGKNTDGQFLRFKANGVETTASDLAKQGYDIEFQADAKVFKATAASEISKTGEIDAVATKANAASGFDYKVTVTKNNNVVASTYVTVKVIDKELAAETNAISSVSLATVEIASVKKGILSTKDTGVKLTSIISNLADGRTGVDLLLLNDADLTVVSDDVTILGATVAHSTGNPPTVTLVPKKAGKVKLTIKSGTATKVIDLQVVDAERKLTTGALSGAGPKVVNTVPQRTATVSLKDQFGEAYNTANIATEATIVEATFGGTKLTDGSAVATKTAVDGTATITLNFEGTNGTGNLVLQHDSKNVVSVPVSVIAPTTAESFNLAASATTIDLNPTTGASSITFTLEKLLSGHYSSDEDLTGYHVEVLDADGDVIFTKAVGPAATVTVNRADLLLETAAKTALGQAEAGITVENVIENAEIGRGLIKVYKTTGELVKSANFNIVDTAANINSVTLSSSIDFTATNNTTLNLGQFLTKVGTTAAAHDSVLRYELVAGDASKVAVYYDSDANAPTTASYSYADGDVLVGIVQSTDVTNTGTSTAPVVFNAATAPFTAGDVVIDATGMDTKLDTVQFNVINRGDKTIAKQIYKFLEQK